MGLIGFTHAQASRVLRNFPDVSNHLVVLSFLRHCSDETEAYSVMNQLRKNCPHLFK